GEALRLIKRERVLQLHFGAVQRAFGVYERFAFALQDKAAAFGPCILDCDAHQLREQLFQFDLAGDGLRGFHHAEVIELSRRVSSPTVSKSWRTAIQALPDGVAAYKANQALAVQRFHFGRRAPLRITGARFSQKYRGGLLLSSTNVKPGAKLVRQRLMLHAVCLFGVADGALIKLNRR